MTSLCLGFLRLLNRGWPGLVSFILHSTAGLEYWKESDSFCESPE